MRISCECFSLVQSTLNLKPGMPLMLLRNLNPKEGLCNGSKLIYERSMENRILQCKVSGSNRDVGNGASVFGKRLDTGASGPEV